MNQGHPSFDQAKLGLTAEIVRELLDYDPETGSFIWRRTALRPPNWNGLYPGKPAGYIHAGNKRLIIAIQTSGKKRRYQASDLAWLWMNGEWAPREIDHRNTDATDNSWSNLRLATSSQNSCNQKIQRKNTSGAKGVSYDKNRHKFAAVITVRRKHYHLGRFETLEEAATAYAHAAAELHGEFARTE